MHIKTELGPSLTSQQLLSICISLLRSVCILCLMATSTSRHTNTHHSVLIIISSCCVLQASFPFHFTNYLLLMLPRAVCAGSWFVALDLTDFVPCASRFCRVCGAVGHHCGRGVGACQSPSQHHTPRPVPVITRAAGPRPPVRTPGDKAACPCFGCSCFFSVCSLHPVLCQTIWPQPVGDPIRQLYDNSIENPVRLGDFKAFSFAAGDKGDTINIALL